MSLISTKITNHIKYFDNLQIGDTIYYYELYQSSPCVLRDEYTIKSITGYPPANMLTINCYRFVKSSTKTFNVSMNTLVNVQQFNDVIFILSTYQLNHDELIKYKSQWH